MLEAPQADGRASLQRPPAREAKKEYVGLDVFLDWTGGPASQLGPQLEKLAGDLKLQSISNRGVKVYPGRAARLRLLGPLELPLSGDAERVAVTHAQTVALQQRVDRAGFDVVKTEGLYTFDGQRGYSLGQGE